jgi:CubicO group peptidase (beta-lactamase class C family)
MPIDRHLTLANWLEAPNNRTSFQHVREIVPTALIARDGRTPSPLPEQPLELDDLTVEAPSGTVPLGEHLEATWCDGIAVLKDGELVYERYLNGMTPRTTHLLMSVSKSFCGALLGILDARGVVSVDDEVTDVATDLAGTAIEGATVRQLIDMTAGTDCLEDYDTYEDPDGDAPLIEYERQSGYRPLDGRPFVGILEHFKSLGNVREHGAAFEYRSVLTNMVAHVLESATGTRYPELLGRELWAPLGPEYDAEVMVDGLAFPAVEGGQCCTLRDLLRFGQALGSGGRIDGRQVLPEAWIADTTQPDAKARADWEASEYRSWAPDGQYRNAFWVLHPGRIFTGIGIHGQYCWNDLQAGVTIARFSTQPLATSDEVEADVLAGFGAIAAAVS